MNKTTKAKLLRLLLTASFAAAIFVAVVDGLGGLLGPDQTAALMPFAAAAVSVASLQMVVARVDKLMRRFAYDTPITPYAALAEASVRIREGALEQALPGLPSVLAQGAGAQRAELWLAVEDKLVSAATYPPAEHAEPRTVASLAALLAGPAANYVVPVLDDGHLLAALAISKPGPITTADQTLMRDVANGAAMLLRGVAQNAVLRERVRRAGELADELRASRRRLTEARDVERRRLVSELSNATTDQLATLVADLDDAARALVSAERGTEGGQDESGSDPEPDADAAQRAIQRARVRLDELLERFRLIARGVYPSVLRDHGPLEALDELVADLSRPVRLTGQLPYRLPWEIESGIYFLAASAIQLLAGQPGKRPIQLHLEHSDGRLRVRIEDPAPASTGHELRASLAHDGDRLAALGGDLDVALDENGGVIVRAWLPDRLAPAVDLAIAIGSAPGSAS
jgi:signal transduction histidine kinase